ncbi:MAG TPA: hypothetical protein DDY78_16480 [Planctomycetales bacterium]|jgi:hypothetical protein|nr:hypothetical protein [Planctomycetales bacterium]
MLNASPLLINPYAGRPSMSAPSQSSVITGPAFTAPPVDPLAAVAAALAANPPPPTTAPDAPPTDPGSNYSNTETGGGTTTTSYVDANGNGATTISTDSWTLTMTGSMAYDGSWSSKRSTAIPGMYRRRQRTRAA